MRYWIHPAGGDIVPGNGLSARSMGLPAVSPNWDFLFLLWKFGIILTGIVGGWGGGGGREMVRGQVTCPT